MVNFSFEPKDKISTQKFFYSFEPAGVLGVALFVWQQEGVLTALSWCDDDETSKDAQLQDYQQRFQFRIEVTPKALPEVFVPLKKALLKADFPFIFQHLHSEVKLYGSDLERAVWKALLTIKPGEKTSYSHIAKKSQNLKAVRAVASAIGRNPVSLLVPCHRVLRKDGGIGGYACGLERKRYLLGQEAVLSV